MTDKTFANAYTGEGHGTLRCRLFVKSKDRIEQAIQAGFFLDAISICESVIADRLESRLSYLSKQNVNFGTLGRLVTGLKVVELDIKLLYLLDKINGWSKKRNVALHEVVKVRQGESQKDWDERMLEFKQTAIDGYDLVKRIYWCVADLNPNHPDRVFPMPDEEDHVNMDGTYP